MTPRGAAHRRDVGPLGLIVTMKLSVATCYFPVDANIRRNGRYVLAQMRSASQHGADVAHFPEAALSGYAGTDFTSYRGFDWELLDATTRDVRELARRLKLWVILGSTHPLTGRHKPHDSVYVINDRGGLIDRYDKMFCSGDKDGRTGDLAHYSPGNHFTVFNIKGVRCGVLICYEYAFPEMYREVQAPWCPAGIPFVPRGSCVSNACRGDGAGSWHTVPRAEQRGELSRNQDASLRASGINGQPPVGQLQQHLRTSQLFPQFFVRADGIITGRLKRNRAGVLVSTVNTKQRLYDGTADWRDRAMRGTFHSGAIVADRRSHDRTHL